MTAFHLAQVDIGRILVNMSVWESPEALHAYVYQSAHPAV